MNTVLRSSDRVLFGFRLCGVCGARGPALNKAARARGWHYSDSWGWVDPLCVLRIPGLTTELKGRYAADLRRNLRRLPAQLDLQRKTLGRKRYGARKARQGEARVVISRQRLEGLQRMQFDLEKVLGHEA